MKKMKIRVATLLLFVGVFTVTLHANPLPSCRDEWCHYTEPEVEYRDWDDGNGLFSLDDSDYPGPSDWMLTNCPNWPDAEDPIYRVLFPFHNMYNDYEKAIHDFWRGKNPHETGITYDGEQEKLREEAYLAQQRRKLGRNIPFCLTEKAQSRVAYARKETEKYLQDAPQVPMVRDRLALLAKIEEANAKTAKEQRLEKFYKKPAAWQIDKNTLDAWWAETHPDGKPLTKQAVKQRYRDYFATQEWKKVHPDEPRPAMEEIYRWKEQKKIEQEEMIRKSREGYENKVLAWWSANYPNRPRTSEPESKLPYEMTSAYDRYEDTVDRWWLKYHKEHSYRDCASICQIKIKWSVPFEEREQFYLDKQKEINGKEIPYCLSGEEKKYLWEQRKEMEDYLKDPKTQNRPYFEEKLNKVLAEERANEQLAEELGLTSRPQEQKEQKIAPLVRLGIVPLVLAAGGIFFLIRRRKK